MDTATGSEIAVIGMACRLPGAPDVDTYWANLQAGVESVRRFTEEELEAGGVPRHLRRAPNYVPAHGTLDDLDRFDAAFFGLSPQDAAIMDPQHRVFLECVGTALDDAGIDPARAAHAIGVFAGCGMNTYFQDHLATNPDLIERLGYFHVRHTGNDKDFLATRVSYAFDLKGPSVSVQTACSTSLVAVHVAAQSLLSGECDVALAGGSTIELKERWGYLYQEGGIQDPDGHCRAFDADSQGTVFGSGAGVVVLKRYQDAVADGDVIHAVLRSTAINNDGAQKVGYLAPSVDGQAAAAAEALALSGLEPSTISYVECHGTGTPVGDPIELAALKQAYGPAVGGGRCAIGSVKTNIGHLDTAAGVASLIKVVQALKHRQIPPSLHFRSPNPKLGLDQSPFYVNDRLQEWATNGPPRRAAVNSLGVGGTNAHVIVEEAPAPVARPAGGEPTDRAARPYVLPLSAKTPDALDRATENLARHLAEHPSTNLVDAAHTLWDGRSVYPYRRALVGADTAELRAHGQSVHPPVAAAKEGRSLGFMFPGGGAQYPNMARDLYDAEPVFRTVVDQALAIVKQHENLDLRPLMFPAEGKVKEASVALQRPSRALPALLAIEIAMARLWMSWGLEPEGMIGHSAGEYAAACIAGVMSTEDALRLMCLRGRLFETLPAGGMLSVPLPEAEVRPLLPDALSIATVNAPSMCVVSGTTEAIDAFEQTLLGRGVEAKRVPIDVAAHSPMVDAILDEYRAFLTTIPLRAPQRPFASNLSGTWITDAEATSPDYWVRHLRQTVRFADGVRALFELPNPVLLEIGPGHTLSTFADVHDERPEALVVQSTMRHPKETVADDTFLYRALGAAWTAGVEIPTPHVRGQGGRRIALPTYPFAREKHWIEPGATRQASSALMRREDVDSFFSIPSWKPTAGPAASTDEDLKGQTWVVFADDRIAPSIIERATAAGADIVRVDRGRSFYAAGPSRITLRAGDGGDYGRLFDELRDRADSITRIVHTWNVTGATVPSDEAFDRAGGGWRSLFHLAKALGEASPAQRIDLAVLTDGLFALPGDADLHPIKATALGPVRVLPRELPTVSARVIDLDAFAPETTGTRASAQKRDLVWTTLLDPRRDAAVALRQGRRYVQGAEPVAVAAPADAGPLVAPDGTYLVTGGTGGLALDLVAHLAETAPATFVLVSRSGLPPREEWDAILQGHARQVVDGATVRKIQSVRAIERRGATVRVEAADVTDTAQMQAVVRAVTAEHGPIRGVFHAAGVLDDALIAMKTEADVERVLAPKVTGTQVLRDVLADQPLNAFVLFSSVSALLGLPGQVDYCAANAYLDAFAHQNTLAGIPTTSVDWSAWQEVGMAAALTGTGTTDRIERDIDHPILTHWTQVGTEHRFTGTLDATHWIVDEHRLPEGDAVLPGTGYLELVAAALRAMRPDEGVEIREIAFAAPMYVSGPTDVDVRLVPENGDAFEATVLSRVSDGAWIEHARGAVSTTSDAEAPVTADLRDADDTSGTAYTRETGFPVNHQNDLLGFGPRWDNLEWMRMDGAVGWARLSLRDAFAGDVEAFGQHPALLDIATAFALPVLEGYAERGDFYVPIMYESARLYRPFPSSIISRMECADTGAADVVTFQVSIWSEEGKRLADIEAFTMKRIDPAFLTADTATTGPVQADPDDRIQAEAGGGGLAVDADQALTPAEGRAVFARILAGRLAPQVVVSTVDLAALQAQIDAEYALPEGGATVGAESGPVGAAGADAPRDDIERTIARIWTSMLGVPSIGIHDDFFEAGGHSLIAVRVFAKVKKELGVDLPLSTLLQAPTIAEYADVIRAVKGIDLEENNPAEESDAPRPEAERSAPERAAGRAVLDFNPLVPIQRKGDGTPFFCVHGAGGNVLNFRDLAVRLGDDQPVYGLQARGVDGRDKPHGTIEEMATAYLAAIRTVQPEGPYLLGGYSGGGVIAYEMAQQLLAEGEEIGLLVFLDTYFPHLPPAAPKRLSERLRMRIDRLRTEGWTFVADYLKTRWIVERNRMREWGIKLYEAMGWPMPIAFREILMVRNFHNAVARYTPEPYPRRIVLFGASDKGDLADRVDDDLGWSPVVGGGMEIYTIPGNHDTLVLEPNITTLTERLRAELETATRQIGDLRGTESAGREGDGGTLPAQEAHVVPAASDRVASVA